MEDERRIELEQEIATVETEIEEVKVELNEVRAKLGKEPIEKTTSTDGEEPSQDTPTPAESGETEEDKLKAKEVELIQLLVSKQMKLRALQKELDDILANQGMDAQEE